MSFNIEFSGVAFKMIHSVIDPADIIVVLNQLSNKRAIQISIHKAASSNSEMGLFKAANTVCFCIDSKWVWVAPLGHLKGPT